MEIQLQPYFYKEYAKKSSQQDVLLASELSEEDFKSMDVLKLNYSSKAHFIYDNRTREDTLNKSRDVFGTNSFPSEKMRDQYFSNLNETNAMNTTEISEDLKTNIGIRREDIFNFLIVNKQDFAENLRHQKSSGEIRYLSDYPKEKREMLRLNTFALYKFSNKPASVFFSADKKS